MPSVNSSSVLRVWLSSTVITPSLPTLVNASAMSSPIVRVLRGDGRDVRDRLLALDRGRGLVELGADRLDRGVDAALEIHRVGAGGDVLQAGVDERLGEHGRGGRAVPGDVVGLGRDRLDQLRAEVLVRVDELDLAGDGDAVVGDDRRAEGLVEDDVAPARAERDLDRVGQLVDTALERAAGVLVEAEDLRHDVFLSESCPLARWRRRRTPRLRMQLGAPSMTAYFSMMARTSRADRTRYSSPPYLTSVPPYLL